MTRRTRPADWDQVQRDIRRSNWLAFAVGVSLATFALLFCHFMGWS